VPKSKELVAPKPKSWFVRQKILGANIHETEGLLERNIAEIGVLLDDGAGSDIFSITGGEGDTSLAGTVPADRGTVEAHDVSGDAAACVGVSIKIAVNPPCQNVTVVSARVATRQVLVVSASHVYKSTLSGCHMDRARIVQE